MKKILFVHAYWQRCGNNYLSGILKTIYDAEVPIEDASEFPFPKLLSGFYESVKSLRNSKYAKYMRQCVSEGLVHAIKSKSEREFIIVKNTIAVPNLEEFISATPNERHFLLVRDPRDVAYSYFAALRRSLKSGKGLKSWIKRFLFFVGYYHLRIGQRIRSRFVMFNSISSLKQTVLLKYEELLEVNPSVVAHIAAGRTVDVNILQKLRNLPVFNTSFKEAIGAKKTWAHNPKTEGFKPKGRWRDANPFEAFVLSKILFPDSFLARYDY